MKRGVYRRQLTALKPHCHLWPPSNGQIQTLRQHQTGSSQGGVPPPREGGNSSQIWQWMGQPSPHGAEEWRISAALRRFPLPQHHFRGRLLPTTQHGGHHRRLIGSQGFQQTDHTGVSTYFIKQTLPAFIAPLHHIFNLSLNNCIVPAQLKIAKVIPIFKAGNKSSMDN